MTNTHRQVVNTRVQPKPARLRNLTKKIAKIDMEDKKVEQIFTFESPAELDSTLLRETPIELKFLNVGSRQLLKEKRDTQKLSSEFIGEEDVIRED